ncbi:MAG: helix-turn-helix domain-containing protein, partial [Streptosporangiaceae bacterium]
MNDDDPRLLLAKRLRALREESWPGRRITQPQLARALGGVSVPLISSWESLTNPRIPPSKRLDALAALFATARSFDGESGHIVALQDLNDGERQALNDLKQELRHMRSAAMRAGSGAAGPEPEAINEIAESLSGGPWRFEDGNAITIVCAQWPSSMIQKIPYTSVE